MDALTLSPRTLSFLSLPPEVRAQIYTLVIRPTRLSAFCLLDQQWSLKPADTAEDRRIPPLCFACRKIYDETIPLVYSQAILEIAPARATSNFFYVATKAGTNEDILPITYTKLTDIHGFCRPDLIRLIKRAHFYSNQFDAIDGSCYDSLIRWIAENTSIVDVQVSGRAMVRIREQPRFDTGKVMSSFPPNVPCKVVRIWTTERSWRPWEWVKINKLYTKYEQDLPHVQIYFLCPGQKYGTLHLDPRWFKRETDISAYDSMNTTEGNSVRAKFERQCSWVDYFMQQTVSDHELACYEQRRRYQVGDSWLYQMIVVPDLQNAETQHK